MNMNHTVAIADADWRPCGGPEADDRTKLLAPPGTLTICGVPMHVEAYLLKGQELQEFESAVFENEDQAFFLITGTSVCVATIFDRSYAIVCTPHGD
jgi:hypothetical protein